jgi:hypothetical protein
MLTNISKQLESAVQQKSSATPIEQLIKSLSDNPILHSVFGTDKTRKHVEEAAKTFSPQVFALYANFVGTYSNDITATELLKKIQAEGYDYLSMFDRVMNTLSKFSPKQQDYIVLRSIDAAAQARNDALTQLLVSLSQSKANIVSLLLDLFRMIEPFIIRSCQEVIQGVVTDKKIDETLTLYNAAIKSAFGATDKIIEAMNKQGVTNKADSKENIDTNNKQ